MPRALCLNECGYSGQAKLRNINKYVRSDPTSSAAIVSVVKNLVEMIGFCTSTLRMEILERYSVPFVIH